MVSPGSRGRKPNSRDAFAQLRYQKYCAISIAPGSTGELMSHCLKKESISFEPVMAKREGNASLGAEIFVSLSNRPKNLEEVQFAPPNKERPPCRPFFMPARDPVAASRTSTQLDPP